MSTVSFGMSSAIISGSIGLGPLPNSTINNVVSYPSNPAAIIVPVYIPWVEIGRAVNTCASRSPASSIVKYSEGPLSPSIVP